ncbi:MAG: gliding motility-associated C-terminal domain-containing protein [Crocinitomicaceae bacterium]|nr:gliding motility-associated C-terminal domain-containing protein [Crocinitomicaceae bacterium]
MKCGCAGSLIGLLLLFSSVGILSQDPVPTVEYTVHYGDYGDGVDLTGYVTYDIYLQFNSANPNPALTTVFSAVPDLGPAYTIEVDAECGTFQHDQGGITVESIQCVLLPFFQSLEWDSFFTIGNSCKGSSDANLFLITTDNAAIDAWENTIVPGNFFDGGSNMVLNNTAIFRLPGADPLIFPDSNDKILIARITSCGSICMNYAIQYFPNYQGPGSQYTTALQNACFDHPCIANPMDTQATVGSDGCFGDAAQVTLTDGGNGPVQYTLFSGNNIGSGVQQNVYANQNDGLTITGLAEGDYYISMIDDVGCRDTTNVFSVTQPMPLTVSAEVIDQSPCSGAGGGSIEVDCSGGTGTIEVMAGNMGPFVCGQTISGLPCGNVNVSITDDNGCQANTQVFIPCITELTGNLTATGILCYGAGNGSIVGTISGGSGLLVANLIQNGSTIASQSGNNSVNVSFTNLDGGSYTVTATDANDCMISFDLTIDEPDEEFSTSFTVTGTSCFSSCDGTAGFVVVGGASPVVTQLTTANGNPVGFTALCAGNYNWVTTDGNGCEVSGSINVTQPPEIIYEVATNEVSCFEVCDGTIDVTSVSGGTNSFSYSLIPNNGTCTPPCSGTSVHYQSVCAGNYSVVITDGNGCIKIAQGVNVQTPPELEIILDISNVSCFGFNDGEVTVSFAGGTGNVVMEQGEENLPYTEGELIPGTYSFSIVDELGCTASDDVVITEPPLLTAALGAVSDVGCGGGCDGDVSYQITGGILPYNYSLSPTGQSGAVNGIIASLCAESYELHLFDANGCSETLEFDINEPDPLFINITLDNPTCTGMFDGSASVIAGGGSGDLTTIVSPENFEIEQINDTSFIYTEVGEGSFVIDVFDQNGCSIRDTVEVIPDIITDMVLTMSSTPESCWSTVDGTATVVVQNGNQPISYQWDDPQMQQTTTATGLPSNYTFTVVVTDMIGCTLTGQVYVEPTLECFNITTGITPNGDGVNDTWVLGGLEYFPDADIYVYNRWGQQVYYSNGYGTAWDGTFNGEPLPVADYYFVIDYAEDKEPITGTVTIKY